MSDNSSIFNILSSKDDESVVFANVPDFKIKYYVATSTPVNSMIEIGYTYNGYGFKHITRIDGSTHKSNTVILRDDRLKNAEGSCYVVSVDSNYIESVMTKTESEYFENGFLKKG